MVLAVHERLVDVALVDEHLVLALFDGPLHDEGDDVDVGERGGQADNASFPLL